MANANVSHRADGSVLISIPPMESGNAIRDGLMDAFAQTLGPERNAVFLALQANGSNRLGSNLSEFGTQQRTFTFARVPSSDGGSQTITLRDEQKNTGGGGMISSYNVPTLESLPPTLQWALPLVPPDF